MSETAKPAAELRTVASRDAGLRIDRWFKTHFPHVSHGALEKMLRKGQIRVDGGRVKANHRVRGWVSDPYTPERDCRRRREN